MPTRSDDSSGTVWPVARNPVRFDSIGRVCWVRLVPRYHEVPVAPEQVSLIAGFSWRQLGTALTIDDTDHARLRGFHVQPCAPDREHPDAPYPVACLSVLAMREESPGHWAPVPDAPPSVCLLPMSDLLAAVASGRLDLARIRQLARQDVLRAGAPIYRVTEGPGAPLSSDEMPARAPWRPPLAD